jgi:hypothetical protein
MADYLSGSAWVQVVPSLDGFQAETRKQLAAMDVSYEVKIVPKLDPDATLPATEGGQRVGVAYADAFDRAVQSRVRGAIAALPKIDVDADTDGAEGQIAQLRLELEELSKVEIGIDLDPEEALAIVESLRAEMAELAKDADSIKIRVDAASAEATLAAVGEQIDQLDHRNAVVHVQYDVDQASLAKAQDAPNNSTKSSGINKATALGGLAVVAAPAALGLAITAVPAALAAIGVAAEKDDVQVKTAFDSMTKAAKTTVQEGFAPIAPTLINLSGEAKTSLEEIKPELSGIASSAAPMVQILGDGLIKATHDGVGAVNSGLTQVRPVIQAVSDDFSKAEQGAEGFGKNLDVKEVAQGVTEFGDDIKQALPAVGALVSDVLPLANAVGSVLGPAFRDTAQDASILRPEIDAVSGAVSFLAPGIAAVLPPVLAVAAGSKILTGSWTSWSAAGTKLLSPLQNLPGTLQAVAGKVGITTAATAASQKADLESAASKAVLVAAADAEAVAELKVAGAATGTAAEQLALAEAQTVAAASAKAAAIAEKSAAAATDGLKLALGPVVAVVGLVGFALSGFIGKGDDAKTTAADLSQQIIQLGQDTPAAAASLAASSGDLQAISGSLKAVGTSAIAFSQAYSGGVSQAESYTNGLTAAQSKLGATMLGIREGDGNKFYQTTAVGAAQTTLSVQQLSAAFANGSQDRSLYSADILKQVDLYDQYNLVVPQAANALKAAQAAAAANTAALASEGVALSASQKGWQAFGDTVAKRVADFNSATAGIKGITDATVNSDATFVQAQQTYQQLGAAVAQAKQGVAQASQGITDAQHGISQASQGVADAQHGEAQAAAAVVDAQQGVVSAERAAAQSQQAYNQSLAGEKTAQQALSAARKQAVQDLLALNRQVTDQGDTEAEAKLRLLDATTAVKEAGLQGKTLASLGAPTAANEKSYQLLLTQSEAQHNLNDVTAQSQTLAAQQAAAQKAGVNGAAGVISAQQQVTQSQQQASQAAQALVDSQGAVTKASKAVKDAQYQEQQAHIATSNAQYAEKQAQQQLTSAKDAAKTASDALKLAQDADSGSLDLSTAAGVRNFQAVEGLFEANFAATGNINEATTATENQGQQLHITAGNVQEVIGKLTGLNGSKAEFGIVGQPSVDVSELINAANQQGLDPKTLGFTSAQIGNARRDVPTGSSYADGGPISGVGGPREDANLIWASRGEYMQPADTTSYYGLGVMEAIRAKAIPKEAFQALATGGPVGVGQSLLAANLELLEVGGMFQALRGAYNATGFAQHELPGLPKKNPPVVQLSFDIGGGNASPASGGSPAAAQAYAASQLARFGWGPDQMPYLIRLWNQESGWINQVNKSSGAYGIPQSLPGDKMASAGADWRTNVDTQINWGLGYINGRYGDPQNAWAHEVSHNWYDEGGWLPPGLTMVHNNTGGPEPVLTTGQLDGLVGAAASNGGGGGEFTGDLYLDSGAFLGHVRGVVGQELESTGTAIDRGTR